MTEEELVVRNGDRIVNICELRVAAVLFSGGKLLHAPWRALHVLHKANAQL